MRNFWREGWFPSRIAQFLGGLSQPVAGPSLGDQPVRGMHRAVIDRLPLSKKDTEAGGLDEARQVFVKVGTEAPKQAKEKFWRVVVAATTLGDTLVELQLSEWTLFVKRKSNTSGSIVQFSANLGFTLT